MGFYSFLVKDYAYNNSLFFLSICWYMYIVQRLNQKWAAQVISARAITLKILRRKRFRKPKKIIAPQAQPQAQAQV